MNAGLKYKIDVLCNLVEEVMNNNDWPTEEGQQRDGIINPIEMLIIDIRKGINTEPTDSQ